MNVGQSVSEILWSIQVRIFSLNRTTLELVFSDYGGNFVQKLLSDFSWIIVEQFRRINSAENLEIIVMSTLATER